MTSIETARPPLPDTFPDRLMDGYRAFRAARYPTEEERYRRLAEAGIKVVYPVMDRVPPTMEEVWAMTAGTGTAILDELLAQRHRIR